MYKLFDLVKELDKREKKEKLKVSVERTETDKKKQKTKRKIKPDINKKLKTSSSY